MDIKINGKTFKFNDDIKFGILEMIEKQKSDAKSMKRFWREALIPTPSEKEMYNFRESDIINIFVAWKKFREEQTIEFKKKLSQ